MDSLENYRKIVQEIITKNTEVPYAYGEIEFETIFDKEKDRYLLMIVGWENGKRVHGCLIHIDIINGKFWIQRDGTEYGVANELVDAGIAKSNIVLGFRSAEVRKHSDFAAA
jgi:hypothetical protein